MASNIPGPFRVNIEEETSSLLPVRVNFREFTVAALPFLKDFLGIPARISSKWMRASLQRSQFVEHPTENGRRSHDSPKFPVRNRLVRP